jgi:hypothetical protein
MFSLARSWLESSLASELSVSCLGLINRATLGIEPVLADNETAVLPLHYIALEYFLPRAIDLSLFPWTAALPSKAKGWDRLGQALMPYY